MGRAGEWALPVSSPSAIPDRADRRARPARTEAAAIPAPAIEAGTAVRPIASAVIGVEAIARRRVIAGAAVGIIVRDIAALGAPAVGEQFAIARQEADALVGTHMALAVRARRGCVHADGQDQRRRKYGNK